MALAAPSSHFRREHFDEALEFLTSYGFRVCFHEGVFSREDYLAGSDKRRFDEFQMYLDDPEIDAIFLLRGGFGCARMFHLPIEKFSISHPKFILGMSDHTLLLNHLSNQHKMLTYHCPIITTELFRTLPIGAKNKLIDSLQKPKPAVLKPPQYHVLQAGNAKGRLWGGNMSIVQTSFGTPFEQSWKNSILFLEDNNEMEYRLDRIFAHLYLTGHLHEISGLILGDFTDKENNLHSMDFLKRIVNRYIVNKKIPVLAKLKVGHKHATQILPIGGQVSIQNRGKSLTFESLA